MTRVSAYTRIPMPVQRPKAKVDKIFLELLRRRKKLEEEKKAKLRLRRST
jgi:hypothetical protein